MSPVTLRLYAGLAELAGPHHLVPLTAPRSVKDAVESVGVPHVEVALLLVDGVPVDLDHRLEGGERVAVLPPLLHLGHEGAPTLASPPPPLEPRFVCDVHLGTLARRLRLLGLDTLAPRDGTGDGTGAGTDDVGTDDAALAALAAREDRILLSRDRGLLMRRNVRRGYLPRSDDPDEQTLEVVHRFQLGRHLAPSSRCVRCNGGLVAVDADAVADRIPPRTRVAIDRYARCTRCDQLYWPGSHLDALEPFLARVREVASRQPAGPRASDAAPLPRPRQ